jgi:hypothetical protein
VVAAVKTLVLLTTVLLACGVEPYPDPDETGTLGSACRFTDDCARGLDCVERGRDEKLARFCTQSCLPEQGVAPSCGPEAEGGCLLSVMPQGPVLPLCFATCDEQGACSFGKPVDYAGACLCLP